VVYIIWQLKVKQTGPNVQLCYIHFIY